MGALSYTKARFIMINAMCRLTLLILSLSMVPVCAILRAINCLNGRMTQLRSRWVATLVLHSLIGSHGPANLIVAGTIITHS